jgi:multidrug efflux pump subunit AcrB
MAPIPLIMIGMIALAGIIVRKSIILTAVATMTGAFSS